MDEEPELGQLRSIISTDARFEVVSLSRAKVAVANDAGVVHHKMRGKGPEYFIIPYNESWGIPQSHPPEDTTRVDPNLKDGNMSLDSFITEYDEQTTQA